jgi:hypothetical protein
LRALVFLPDFAIFSLAGRIHRTDMTLAALLQYLGEKSGYALLIGNPAQTVAMARAGSHPDPVLGAIVRELYEKSGVESLEAPIERASAVNALGGLRLTYMADDAPPDALRIVERIVYTIDCAFDEEALREKKR